LVENDWLEDDWLEAEVELLLKQVQSHLAGSVTVNETRVHHRRVPNINPE
jgi:hypothetical protein